MKVAWGGLLLGWGVREAPPRVGVEGELSQAEALGGVTNSGCFGVRWPEEMKSGESRRQGGHRESVGDEASACPQHLEWGPLSRLRSLDLDPRLSDPQAKSKGEPGSHSSFEPVGLVQASLPCLCLPLPKPMRMG